jgi:uncharacterized protein YqiB (DUF1249 family)
VEGGPARRVKRQKTNELQKTKQKKKRKQKKLFYAVWLRYCVKGV